MSKNIMPLTMLEISIIGVPISGSNLNPFTEGGAAVGSHYLPCETHHTVMHLHGISSEDE